VATLAYPSSMDPRTVSPRPRSVAVVTTLGLVAAVLAFPGMASAVTRAPVSREVLSVRRVARR